MIRDEDRELKTALDELVDDGPSPDFETSWRRAELRAGNREKRDSGVWRWLAGPAIAAVSAAVIAAIVLFPGGVGTGDARSGYASLDGLSTPDAGAFFSEDVFAGIDAMDLGSWSNEESPAGAPGEQLFVGETDFIMNLQIPSWDQDKERNM